jgi:hypothetical protein
VRLPLRPPWLGAETMKKTNPLETKEKWLLLNGLMILLTDESDSEDLKNVTLSFCAI